MKPVIKRRLKEKTSFSFGGLDIEINPGVFHPQYFFSTYFFLEYIYDIDFKGKTFCEVGCGSAIISLLAFRNGAKVISFDLSENSVSNAKNNYKLNFNAPIHTSYSIAKSDLFDNIIAGEFDFIFINPPYFFKNPKNEEQKAWYCGKDGQYFKKLFYQLPEYSGKNSEILMVLSDNCDIQRITEIANAFGYHLRLKHKRKIKWEWNFLYRLEKI